MMTGPASDYYRRRREAWLDDADTRAYYERERREIERVDALERIRRPLGGRRRRGPSCG
jgi:hypothetical protein